MCSEDWEFPLVINCFRDCIVYLKGAVAGARYLQGVRPLGVKITRNILVWYDK